MAEKDRIRKHKLQVNLSDEENERLRRLSIETDLPISNVIRSLINFGKIDAFWLDDVSRESVDALNETLTKFENDLLFQIERIGNNINQLAYNSNVTLDTEVDDLRNAFSGVIDVERLMLEKLNELQNLVTEFELKGKVKK